MMCRRSRSRPVVTPKTGSRQVVLHGRKYGCSSFGKC
jgi:hypothetical protein